eukprot:scpid107291/ scgid11842/ 
MLQEPGKERKEFVDQTFLCGFPGLVGRENVEKYVLGHMYWVHTSKSEKAEPLDEGIAIQERQKLERRTSALFAMPQRHLNDKGDGKNKSRSDQYLVVKRLYRHYIDSSGGQSGSPVYSYGATPEEFKVHGIHAGYWEFAGAEEALDCNVAVRFREVYRDMLTWISSKKAVPKKAEKISTEKFRAMEPNFGKLHFFHPGSEGMRSAEPRDDGQDEPV